MEEPLATGPASPVIREPALYLYGIVEDSGRRPADLAGLAGVPVRFLSVEGMGVLCHACSPAPYASDDRAKVIAWVQEHADVVQVAFTHYPAVIPFAFNTIIYRPGEDAVSLLTRWIAAQREPLWRLLGTLRGRQEFAVRVRRVPRAPALAPEGRNDGLPAGVAYLLQTRLGSPEVGPAGEVERQVARCLDTMRRLSQDVRLDRRAAEGPLLVRAACLVRAEAVSQFLAGMAHLTSAEDIEIEVTGPWPPYNFVAARPSAPLPS